MKKLLVCSMFLANLSFANNFLNDSAIDPNAVESKVPSTIVVDEKGNVVGYSNIKVTDDKTANESLEEAKKLPSPTTASDTDSFLRDSSADSYYYCYHYGAWNCGGYYGYHYGPWHYNYYPCYSYRGYSYYSYSYSYYYRSSYSSYRYYWW